MWEEAWFEFARFTMFIVGTGWRLPELADKLRSPQYRARYEADLPHDESDEALLRFPLSPDPARARVRVYSTQSTHKTLTSLRQGSMIHVYDQAFALKVAERSEEHTSTIKTSR